MSSSWCSAFPLLLHSGKELWLWQKTISLINPLLSYCASLRCHKDARSSQHSSILVIFTAKQKWFDQGLQKSHTNEKQHTALSFTCYSLNPMYSLLLDWHSYSWTFNCILEQAVNGTFYWVYSTDLILKNLRKIPCSTKKMNSCCVFHREPVMTSTASNCEEASAWIEATHQHSHALHCSIIQYKALIQGPSSLWLGWTLGQVLALQLSKLASLLKTDKGL